MRRRAFLKNAIIGAATVAGSSLAKMRAKELQASHSEDGQLRSGNSVRGNIGRPVRIVSIGFQGASTPLETIARHVDEEGSRGVDVVLLPETCRGQNTSSEEPLHGATVTTMAALASKHKTYIAVPIDRRDGSKRLNTVVMLDRSGQIVCTYDKAFPYWEEFMLHPPVRPGDAAKVYQADFGRVGFATCFDANFPETWRSLSELGAELVIWPSAYSGGRSLQAHAINHHYYIVSSSAAPDCVAYDITGEQLLYQRAKDINVSRISLDLDRGIYHENFNIDKRDKLLSEHPEDIVQERSFELEQWFVLKSKRPGISAREMARQYGLEELRHYIDRSRVAIDKRRGRTFGSEVAFSNKGITDLDVFASDKAT